MTMPVVRGHQPDTGLKLSHDRKVSPRGTWQESRHRWVPGVANSFGLPAGVSCPGKTRFCQSCYAVSSEQASGVSELVHHNLRMLQAADSVDGMTVLLCEMVDRYVAQADRLDLQGPDRIFRIHWDGDFFSVEYARAWHAVIAAHRTVQFWAYTRSFRPPVDVVGVLADLPNLALYLSVDEHNAVDAFERQAAFPRVRLAFCTVDYKTGLALAGDDRQQPIICPENAGRVSLMTDGRGACVDCAVCTVGRRDVMFSTSHRLDVRTWEPHKPQGRRIGVAATIEQVRSWLREHGSVEDPHGRAVHVLAEAVACSYQSTWKAVKDLEADGVLRRTLKGRNTLTITYREATETAPQAAVGAAIPVTFPGFDPSCQFCQRAEPNACAMHAEPGSVKLHVLRDGDGGHLVEPVPVVVAAEPVDDFEAAPSPGDPGLRWVLHRAAEEHEQLVDYMGKYAALVDEVAVYKQALIDARELIGNLRAQRDLLLGKAAAE